MARSLVVLLVVLAISSQASAQCAPAPPPKSASTVVSWLQSITAKSQALIGTANSIKITSTAEFLIGTGPFPIIIAGLTDIVTTVTTTAIEGLMGASKFTSLADQKSIIAALTEFVKIHQQLLSILIGKSGLFSTIPYIGIPVSTVLRSIEGVVDAFAYELIGLFSDATQANAGMTQKNMLDMTVTQAITAYSA